MNGTIRFFNHTKGFGFITDDEDGKDYFVHITDVTQDLQLEENMEVTFTLVDGERGPRAKEVKAK